MKINLDTENALLFLLQQKYLSEFEIINRRNQHPDGYTFPEWLFKKGLITESELKRLDKEISQLKDE